MAKIKKVFSLLKNISIGKTLSVSNALMEDDGDVTNVIHATHESGELLIIELNNFDLFVHTLDGKTKYFICEIETYLNVEESFPDTIRLKKTYRQSANSPVYDFSIERSDLENLNFCEYKSSSVMRKAFLIQTEKETKLYLGNIIKESEIKIL